MSFADLVQNFCILCLQNPASEEFVLFQQFVNQLPEQDVETIKTMELVFLESARECKKAEPEIQEMIMRRAL